MRISPRTVRQALKYDKLVVPLLRANLSVEQARQELRWIQQELPKAEWPLAVQKRALKVPLQYILQSQPFGPIDIKCREGVLIPRWETEEWCLRLAELLITSSKPLKILDACTGTGCIPLLLNHRLNEHNPGFAQITAFDVSKHAIQLAKENLLAYATKYPVSAPFVEFKHHDIFERGNFQADLVVSNPPYIPIHDYHTSVANGGVEESVRRYEPSTALIGDNEFYTALVDLVLECGAQGFVFELGYELQAKYVRDALDGTWSIETVYDGAGNVRCVVGWTEMSFLEGMKEDKD